MKPLQFALLTVTALLALASGAAGDTPRRNAEILTKYLDRDVFIREGVGLEAVKIGTTFRQVQQAWGRPRGKHNGLPFIGADDWFFRADAYTEIRLSGKDRVETMAFRGQPGSPYETRTGARFGMPPFQILSLYGPREFSQDGAVLDYPGRGVRFHFTVGVLEGIEIFPPRR